jgi:WD domain, G-beta repeat
LIIFGWRTRSRISQVERGTCPICQADRDIVVQTNKVWFTFFFVPIFPIGAVSQQRICSQCGTVFPAGWSGTLAPTRGMSFSSPPVHTNQTATTAIIALVMAVLSPALICLCYASIPASIAAIVLGHISLSSIAKAQGQLDGRGLSIASLVLAYPVLLLSIVFMSYSLFLVYRGNTGLATNSSSTAQGEQENFPGNSDADAVSRFQNAEQMILALQGDSPGHGNNAEAIRLADTFAEMMLKVRESAFTTGKKPLFQLSSGQFVTYVELHDDRALFLVHVPDYRKFSNEAKEQLAQLAWTVAQLTVQKVLPEDAQLAVALKGTMLYGDILIGYVTSHEGLRDHYRAGKKQDLLAFFPKQAPKQSPQETTDSAIADSAGTTMPPENFAAPPENLPSNPSTQPTTASALDSGTESMDSSDTTPAAPPRRPPRERHKPFEPRIYATPAVKVARSGWGYKSIAWSHNGKWLAGGKIDDTLTLVDAQSGETISEVKKLSNLSYFTALAFSFDDGFLVATTNSGDTALWQVDQQGKLEHIGPLYRHAKGAQVLASSPRHLYVASAGKDGTITWQTLTSPFQTKLLQHFKREPLAIALPKVGVEAWAMNGETILKFSLRDASVLAEYPLGHRNARAACFNVDGSQAVLVDYRDIYLVNCQDRVESTKIYTADNDVLYSVAFHPNHRWIAVGGRGNVLILDVIDRAPLARITLEAFLTVEHLQFSPDGKKLAVCHQSSDANIHLYEIGSLL